MCNCNNKISSICDTLTNTDCVVFTGDVSDKSDLCACGDYKLSDVIVDIYSLIDGLEGVSVALADNCITYEKDEEGKNNLQDILLKHSQLLCELKESIETLETAEPEIDLSSLDLNCLTEDPCYEGDRSLTTVLQLIINKTCNE